MVPENITERARLNIVKVATLASGSYGAGEHALTWNGTDAAGDPVASGMYLYKLSTPRGSSLKKCVLLK
jgi:flagellar hook assembly protein FlgD